MDSRSADYLVGCIVSHWDCFRDDLGGDEVVVSDMRAAWDQQADFNRVMSLQIETINNSLVPPHVCHGLMCATCRIAKAVHALNEGTPAELERCPRCGGAGQYRWYLGDEFNSQGYSECEICEGTGMVEK